MADDQVAPAFQLPSGPEWDYLRSPNDKPDATPITTTPLVTTTPPATEKLASWISAIAVSLILGIGVVLGRWSAGQAKLLGDADATMQPATAVVSKERGQLGSQRWRAKRDLDKWLIRGFSARPEEEQDRDSKKNIQILSVWLDEVADQERELWKRSSPTELEANK